MTAAQIIAMIQEIIQGATLGAEALVAYIDNLLATWKANDQATRDELHAAALAAANAEAPPGATPLP